MDEFRTSPAPNLAGPAPIRWYSRTVLDQYLAEADAERTRLQGVIADANERLARANSALGLHQTMMEMLLESQRDVREIRRAAEAKSAEIIAAGEHEAERILVGGAVPSADGARPVVRNGRASPGGDLFAPADPAFRVDGRREGTAPDEEFFDYLKGALSEDGPLGPLPQ